MPIVELPWKSTVSTIPQIIRICLVTSMNSGWHKGSPSAQHVLARVLCDCFLLHTLSCFSSLPYTHFPISFSQTPYYVSHCHTHAYPHFGDILHYPLMLIPVIHTAIPSLHCQLYTDMKTLSTHEYILSFLHQTKCPSLKLLVHIHSLHSLQLACISRINIY